MYIGTLFTEVIEKHEFQRPLEGGVFEIRVHVPKAHIDKSGDPFKYVMRQIAINLANGVHRTTVPKEFWNIRFSREIQRAFNLPPVLSFNL